MKILECADRVDIARLFARGRAAFARFYVGIARAIDVFRKMPFAGDAFAQLFLQFLGRRAFVGAAEKEEQTCGGKQSVETFHPLRLFV